jgi:sulfur relay (sulfurtransferase) complex TusBCD TusD component (DsrE family)
MGKLLIVLFTPPIHSQNTDTIYEFAKAAVAEGNEVTVFCDADATYNLIANQIKPDGATPTGKMAQLIKMGIKVLICGESARIRGIDLQNILLKGVVRSSLGKLAELMEQNNRIIAFG